MKSVAGSWWCEKSVEKSNRKRFEVINSMRDPQNAVKLGSYQRGFGRRKMTSVHIY